MLWSISAWRYSKRLAVVRDCLEQARGRLRGDVDLEGRATYVLVTMEGGMMLARSYREVEPFDQAIAQLRQYFQLLARVD